MNEAARRKDATEMTRLAPLLVLATSILILWSLWAQLLYAKVIALCPQSDQLIGVLARLLLWVLPAGFYLYRYWGRRALEPLALGFPLGRRQALRAFLITIVVGLGLLVGTGAQGGLAVGTLLQRLLALQHLDLSAPVFEEFVFRGVIVSELLNWTHDTSRSPLELRLKFWAGQLGAALLFLVVHWPFWLSHFGLDQALTLSLPVLSTGLILGFVFASTRSIWPCIFLHALNNALSQVL
jgi:hypothetical protein